MNYANEWFKTTITKQAALRYLQNYGHLLKWQNYKEHVLEVGCGEGSITKNILFSHIKDRVRKLVAVDKLDAMIDLAKKENQLEEIEYHVSDIMDEKSIEKMEGQFEHIFSFFVAHLIPDNRTFFDGLWKMLKPGGQVFVTIFSDQCLKRSFGRQSKEEKWAKYVKPETIFSDYTDKPDEYLSGLLTDVGFQVDVCKVEHKTYQVEHTKDLIMALLQMYQNMGSFPANLREEFMEENIKIALEECIYLGEPDKYEICNQQLFCICTKV